MNISIAVISIFRDYEKEDHTPAQVKQLIESHLQEKEVIEGSLPANIIIGPFWIMCDGVRQALAKKKKALANSVLEFLAKKLRKQADEVKELYISVCVSVNVPE